MRFAAMAGAVVMLVAGAACADDAHPAIPERPPALKALDGDWIMDGDVMGEPVRYRMAAGPTLQGAFTEIHMNDVQVPSQYEARVFIGHDGDSGNVIAHWMDSFGARYSIPHGTGTVSGDRIEFTLPYAHATFRDTFTHDAASDTWQFVIEAAQPGGSWKHFARYTVRRP